MTNEELEAEVNRIFELDGKRTQGEWHATFSFYPDRGKDVSCINGLTQSILADSVNCEDADFIAAAPQMVEIIHQLWDERKTDKKKLEAARDVLKAIVEPEYNKELAVHFMSLRSKSQKALAIIDGKEG
jgi:hypothetical protein